MPLLGKSPVPAKGVKGYLCVQHVDARDGVAYAGGRREADGEVGDVIADCWYGW